MRGGVVTDRCAVDGIAARQPHSFIDFPGTIAAVLFYSGCNLRCPYCHNPSIVLSSSPPIDPETLNTFLHDRRGILGGIVLSGGEPTIHASAPVLAHRLRDLGYRVKLDTNGLLPEAIETIDPDYLALDIKTAPSHYQTLLGASVDHIESNLARSIAKVRAMGDNAEVRITLAPRVVDDRIIAEIGLLIHGVRNVFLQPMQRSVPLLDPSTADLPPIDATAIGRFTEILAPHVKRFIVRSRAPGL